MSDYWNRPRPQRERDDQPRPRQERDDRPRPGGGYFQGEPGGGNAPGRADLASNRDRRDDRGYDPDHRSRPHPDAPRYDQSGYDRPRHEDSGYDRPRYQDSGYDRPRQWTGRDAGPGRDYGAPDGPRDPVRGEAGRGYGGLSRRDYADRGPGRVFDRGEDYGRGETYPPARAGQDSHDPGEQPRRASQDWSRMRSGRDDDRGVADRPADGARAWFGDDEAERRRRQDMQDDRPRPQDPRRGRRDW